MYIYFIVKKHFVRYPNHYLFFILKKKSSPKSGNLNDDDDDEESEYKPYFVRACCALLNFLSCLVFPVSFGF